MRFNKKELSGIIGERIRQIRNNKGLSIESLSIDCDMDPTQLSRIELGKINTSVYQIYKLCAALDVSVNEVLF